jgi:hypothetical protein
MHLLGAGLPQRAGTLVDRGSRGVDVVDQTQRAWPRPGGEGSADIAPAGDRVEATLGTDASCAAHERQDRQSPPAAERRGQLRGWVGAAQQEAIAHGRNDCEPVDVRTRQLVDDQRGRQGSR